MSLSKALAVNGSPERLRRGCGDPPTRHVKAEGRRYWNAARCALAVLAAHVCSNDVLRAAAPAPSQTAPAPAVRATFKEAIDRAIDKNPTVAAAASGILAAEGLIRQARAGTL